MFVTGKAMKLGVLLGVHGQFLTVTSGLLFQMSSTMLFSS